MSFSANPPHQGVRRRAWLASSALTSLLLPLAVLPAAAQQTASPDLQIREIKVRPPAPARRPTARPATPQRRAARTPAATPSPAPAPQPVEVSAPTAAGDAVVYSPTGVVTPARDTTSSVTVINSQQIEQQQLRSAPDALSTVPGLNIVQTGSPGGQTSIFLRGTNSNHTKFIIDGIDVSDPSIFNRTFDLGQMLTGDIERIEVLRGPQSGLYGADALGGVVSVITKKGEGPPKLSFLAEGGSFSTFNQRASLGGGAENYNYQFNFDHYHAGSVPVTPLELLPPGQPRTNDYYDNKTYSTKLGVTPLENLTFNYVARYTDAKLRFTGEDFNVFPSVPAALQSAQVAHKFFTRGEAVLNAFDGRFMNYFGVNFVDNWNWFFDPNGFNGPVTISKGDRIRYDYRGEVRVVPNALVLFGASDETETFHTGTLNRSSELKGAFVELQTDYDKRLFLVANGRIDDDEFFGAHTTYRIAPGVIAPWTETKFKGSYGTAFKAPTLVQRFQDFPPTFFANPNLQPESSFGYDYGFEQPLLNKQALVGITWFSNHITNLITSGPNGQIDNSFGFPIPIQQNFNIGRARTIGLESFAAVNFTERVKVRADYTYTHAIDDITNLELLRRPRHKYSFQATWNPIDPLTLSATVVHVSDWIDGNRDFSIPRLTAPGYTVVNVAANYQVNQYVQTFGRIDNLFDEHYQNPFGFQRPGIGIYAGMKYTGGTPDLSRLFN